MQETTSMTATMHKVSKAVTFSMALLLLPLQSPPPASKQPITKDGFIKATALGVATALGAAVVSMAIDQYSDVPCTVAHTCDQISTTMKALLIGTHLFTFVLVPATMFVFYDKIEELKADSARSPFVIMLGLSLIMVRIVKHACTYILGLAGLSIIIAHCLRGRSPLPLFSGMPGLCDDAKHIQLTYSRPHPMVGRLAARISCVIGLKHAMQNAVLLPMLVSCATIWTCKKTLCIWYPSLKPYVLSLSPYPP
eukprot:GHRR01000068.1.p2 GENE.GHRR01000068.1~~GHRR01000068.1.p2  ORF type:complete len:252 (+),score=38.85 GHRR01000068.1:637-1392(+)